MNDLKANDVQILAHYTFIDNGSNKQNNKLLGLKWIKERGEWTQQLIEVDRQDVTCWTLFLSFFGQGKLAHISVSLDKICSYLSQYQWQQIKIDAYHNPGTYKYKMFETVCHLANRQLKHKKVALFKEVSDRVPSAFNHYWNVTMNGRFLLDQHHYRLPDAKDLEIRFKNSKIVVSLNQKLTQQDLANIEVGFRYELIEEEEWDGCDSDGNDKTKTVSYYHYPSHPYYKVR